MKYNSYYHDIGISDTCHAVKQTVDKKLQNQAIEKIAIYLISVKAVQNGDILIPAPQHTGNAEYTKKIAEIVAKHTEAIMMDILKCVPHKSIYMQKKEGKKPLIDLFVKGTIPQRKKCFLVDNVIGSGTTFSEANNLFNGELVPLVYALDDTKIQLDIIKRFY